MWLCIVSRSAVSCVVSKFFTCFTTFVELGAALVGVMSKFGALMTLNVRFAFVGSVSGVFTGAASNATMAVIVISIVLCLKGFCISSMLERLFDSDRDSSSSSSFITGYESKVPRKECIVEGCASVACKGYVVHA